MKQILGLTTYAITLIFVPVDANSAISRFRILAPEFVCPKDEDAVIQKPDNTIITLQSSVGPELQVQWTVRWKPLEAPTQRFTLMLWKTARALEAKLNGPQPEPSVFVIENSEMLIGVDYTFNVSEVGRENDETKTFHIDNTQGDTTLHIDGRNDKISVILVGGQETYVDVEFDLEAQVTACFPTQDYDFIWTVTSESGDSVDVSQIAGARLLIPRNTLQAGSTYLAGCQLYSHSDGRFITGTDVAFKVPPRGLEARLNFDYLVISTNQTLEVEATIVNHDNYELSLEWTCSHDGENCENFEIVDIGNSTGNAILFASGLLEPGEYHITLKVGWMNEITVTNATIAAADTELPVIQVEPVPRILNEGTTIQLTANATNVSPTCSLTWYFASQEFLSYNDFINDTCEECQNGEALTETLTIQSLEENFLNELIDYSNDTEWRQVTAELKAEAGRARFVVECGCSLTFNCERKGVVYADLYFELNESPKASELMITPDRGTAMETIFRISTLPAVDLDGILRYNFYCRVGDGDDLLLATYMDHRAVETLLPYVVGGTEVWVEVCDVIGACSSTASRTVELTAGEGRALAMLADDAAAHVRRFGGTEVWVEVCDVIGACSSTASRTVELTAGEGRALAMLADDAAAHVRRCEWLLLTRVAVSAVVTYTNANQPELLLEFNEALLTSLQYMDNDKFLENNKDHYENLMQWLEAHGVDTGSITNHV